MQEQKTLINRCLVAPDTAQRVSLRRSCESVCLVVLAQQGGLGQARAPKVPPARDDARLYHTMYSYYSSTAGHVTLAHEHRARGADYVVRQEGRPSQQ